MCLAYIFLTEEPDFDSIASRDYRAYRLLTHSFNRQLKAYNAEVDLWVDRIMANGYNKPELTRINRVMPSKFILLRKSMLRRFFVLNRHETNAQWLQEKTKELIDINKFGVLGWLACPDYGLCRLQLRFLSNPRHPKRLAQIRKRCPDFLQKYELAVQPLIPYTLIAAQFHAPAILPISEKQFLAIQSRKYR